MRKSSPKTKKRVVQPKKGATKKPATKESPLEDVVAELLRTTDPSKIQSAVSQGIVRRLAASSGSRTVTQRQTQSRIAPGRAGDAHDRDVRFYTGSARAELDFDKDPHDKDPFDRDPGNFARDNFNRDNFDRNS